MHYITLHLVRSCHLLLWNLKQSAQVPETQSTRNICSLLASCNKKHKYSYNDGNMFYILIATMPLHFDAEEKFYVFNPELTLEV